MNELSAAARALAVILAVVSAFVSVPLTAPLLLIFGGFAAITGMAVGQSSSRSWRESGERH